MDLKSARFLTGVTQQELQRETGIHQVRISNAERGLNRLREDEKRALEKALNLLPHTIEYVGDRKRRQKKYA